MADYRSNEWNTFLLALERVLSQVIRSGLRHVLEVSFPHAMSVPIQFWLTASPTLRRLQPKAGRLPKPKNLRASVVGFREIPLAGRFR